MELEIWKTIEEYPNYMVSNMGRIKSLNYGKEKILKQGINKDGYCFVGLCKEAKRKHYKVHRLVATAFLENLNNYPCVNHRDENKQNNCVENLEFCNAKYNNTYGTRLERISKALKGKPNITQSIPIIQLSKEGEFIKQWDSASQASKKLNIDHSSITKCLKGKYKTYGGYRWEYLKEENKKVS